MHRAMYVIVYQLHKPNNHRFAHTHQHKHRAHTLIATYITNSKNPCIQLENLYFCNFLLLLLLPVSIHQTAHHTPLTACIPINIHISHTHIAHAKLQISSFSLSSRTGHYSYAWYIAPLNAFEFISCRKFLQCSAKSACMCLCCICIVKSRTPKLVNRLVS